MESFADFTSPITFLLDSGWIWMPIILAVAFFHSWMYYIQRVYWNSIDWVVLEIKPPKDIEKSPKIMEQVFAGFWGIFGAVTTKFDKYIKGIIENYLTFEMVGINGEIHFFARIPAKYRNMVESQIWSQYPQAEIREVDDYVNGVPADIPNKNWNLWGCRMKLDPNIDVYPIRTYLQHIDIFPRPTTSPFIDPLGSLMEVMSKLSQGEQIWIQLFIRPVADIWVKRAKTEVKKLMDEATLQKGEEEGVSMPVLSPGQREVINGIELKASKKAYESKILFAYIGRTEIFSMANVGATMGIFNQLAALNSNGLRPDGALMTKANYLLAKQRKIYKQRKIMRLMRQRSFWERGYILNIEELATIFHFPTTSVKSPMVPWLESKSAEPPLGLPTG